MQLHASMKRFRGLTDPENPAADFRSMMVVSGMMPSYSAAKTTTELRNVLNLIVQEILRQRTSHERTSLTEVPSVSPMHACNTLSANPCNVTLYLIYVQCLVTYQKEQAIDMQGQVIVQSDPAKMFLLFCLSGWPNATASLKDKMAVAFWLGHH